MTDEPEKAQHTPEKAETPKLIHTGEVKSKKQETKRFTNTLKPTLEDIKRLALIRFGSYRRIGVALGGLSGVYAFQLLNGRQGIKKAHTLQKIADALGVPAEVLREVISDA